MAHISAWDIIKDTFDVFESESDWNKGEFALGHNGSFIDPDGERDDICSFCILGSFMAQKSMYEREEIDFSPDEERKAILCIIKAINYFKEKQPNMGDLIYNTPRTIVEFNDDPATEFVHVKRVGELALRYAE